VLCREDLTYFRQKVCGIWNDLPAGSDQAPCRARHAFSPLTAGGETDYPCNGWRVRQGGTTATEFLVSFLTWMAFLFSEGSIP